MHRGGGGGGGQGHGLAVGGYGSSQTIGQTLRVLDLALAVGLAYVFLVSQLLLSSVLCGMNDAKSSIVHTEIN